MPGGFAAHGYGDLSPAHYSLGAYIGQLWLFIVAPIAGAMIAGSLARLLYEDSKIVDTVVVEKRRVEA